MPGEGVIESIEISYERDSGNYARATQIAETFWEHETANGENTRSSAFQYAIMLRATAQWERMLDLGDEGFMPLALWQLGRKEEARMVARR